MNLRILFPAGLLFASTLAGLATPPGTKPSMECARAKSAAERMICAAPELAQLDRDITLAYQSAIVTVGHSGKTALRRDQAAFTAARDRAAAKGDQDLAAMLALRRDFLASIRQTRASWLGSWANSVGTIEIEYGPQGGYLVRLHAAELSANGWVCEFEDSARVARGVMIVGADSAADVAGGPNEGWTLAFRIAGDILLVETLRPRGSDGPMPFCGKGGNVAGNFFALDAAGPQTTARRN